MTDRTVCDSTKQDATFHAKFVPSYALDMAYAYLGADKMSWNMGRNKLTFFADRTGQGNTTPKTKPTTLQVMHGSRVGQ